MTIQRNSNQNNPFSTKVFSIPDPGFDPTSDPNQLDIFVGKPFWIWDQKEHDKAFVDTEGKCCFNHIISLPEKDGKSYPIFPFQKLIYDAVEQNDNVWILKARGIGISTFLIRYLAWKILYNSDLDHKSIFILAGTREEFANHLKQKMADLFLKNFPQVNIYTKYTEMVLKNTWIKVFPTNSIKSARGFMDVAAVWCDESSFYPESVQEELIYVLEPYQIKSNCKIILTSTPFRPADMMQKIELDKESKYFKLKLPYTYGLDTIFNRAEIQKKMHDIEFEREFNCKYTGKIGNLITAQQLEMLTNLGKEYSIHKIPVSLYTLKSVGIDPGFSSSATGIVVLENISKAVGRNIIRVIESHLIEKGDPNAIVELCWSIWKKHNYMNTYFFIDGSNRAMVNLLKIRWDEPLNWESKSTFGPNTKIRPVNFSTEHRNMLSNLHAIISKGYLAIEEKHDKLLTSLRTAYAEELNLKKEQTSYDDLLDALRLSLKGYKIE